MRWCPCRIGGDKAARAFPALAGRSGASLRPPRPCAAFPSRALRARPLGPSAGGVGLGSLSSLSPAPGGRFRRSLRRWGGRLPLVAGLVLVGVRCGFVLVVGVSFSGGVSWRAGGSAVGSVVASVGRVGAVGGRLPVAGSRFGAFVLWGRGGGRVRFGGVGGGVRFGVVGLGRLSAGGASVCGSLRPGLGRVRSGGRAACVAACAACCVACGCVLGWRGLGWLLWAFPVVGACRRSSGLSLWAWSARCWRPVVRWRSGVPVALMRLCAWPPLARSFSRRPRLVLVVRRSRPVRWRWCARWPLAVPVLVSWCFPPRRARPVCCRPPRRRRVSVVSVPVRGPPPRSPPGWACRSSCSRAGSRLSRPGALGGPPPLLGFGRVGGCWVSCRWVRRPSGRIFYR